MTIWQDNNKEHLKEYRKQYYIQNKETILKKAKEKGLTKLAKLNKGIKAEKNFERILFYSSIQHARKLGIEHTITLSDIIIPTHCSYLNIELTKTRNNGVVWSNASIDRIDSTKGYIPGNIQIISRKANIMKQNATQQELLIFAKNILNLE
jgi:hypothetical protein